MICNSGLSPSIEKTNRRKGSWSSTTSTLTGDAVKRLRQKHRGRVAQHSFVGIMPGLAGRMANRGHALGRNFERNETP